MSIHKNGIKAFIQVLKSESKLIPTQDWDELEKISSGLPEDDEEIVRILEKWLEKESRSQLLEAYDQNLESIIAESPKSNSDNHLGIGNGKSQTPPEELSESSKEQVENAVKNNSRPSDDTKTKEK